MNDKHIEDIGLRFSKEIPTNLSNAGYEKVFRIKEPSKILELTKDKDVKKSIQENFKLGFSKTSCVFHLDSKKKLDWNSMKAMVDFQDGLFDDITLTFLSRQLGDFLSMLEYAKSKNKPLSIYSPFDEVKHVGEAARLVVMNKDVSRLKIKYRKIDRYANLYSSATQILKHNKELHVTFGNLRCNIEGAKSVASEFILRKLGISSFCASFQMVKRKGRSWAPTTTVFNPSTLEYEALPSKDKDFRVERISNVQKVSIEMSLYEESLKSGKETQYLAKKPSFHLVLQRLGFLT